MRDDRRGWRRHLHPVGSFDLDDHPVPTGREEVWRFTPLKRLRGLHDDADRSTAPASAPSTTRPTGVRRRARSAPTSPRAASSGFVPTDRVSARAWPRPPTALRGRRARPRPSSTEPVLVDVTGTGVERRRRRHTASSRVGAHSQGHRRAALRRARRRWPTTSRSSSATAPQLDRRLHRRTGTTTPSTSAPARPGRPRRHAQARRGHLRRRRGPARHHRRVRRPGRRRRDARPLLRRRRPAHRAPAVRRPQRAARPGATSIYKGALQGQGAHTVWIGDVLIRKVAEGIETYEENRNLVLTDGCQADSVPNLEIETGEIEGAGHASATGRFDDEQLFYLQLARHPRGRGAPAGRARLLHRPRSARSACPSSRSSCSRPSRPSSRRTSPSRCRGGVMTFARACALADVPRRRGPRGRRRRHRRRRRPRRRRGASPSRTCARTPPSR